VNLLLADTFTAALAKLPPQEAKAVKTTVFDLQLDPTGKGLSFHRIERSKDPNFWSVRVNRDLRLIVHKSGDSMLVAYVAHHDPAYAWAERRRIEAHPRTGAMQIIEVRELVEEAEPSPAFEFAAPAKIQVEQELPLFAALDEDDLLSVGVPSDWVDDVRTAGEEGFFKLAGHLPGGQLKRCLNMRPQDSFQSRCPWLPSVPTSIPIRFAESAQSRIRKSSNRRSRFRGINGASFFTRRSEAS
jgi:hypothetical protein